jgi:hypothetical protein
MERNEFCKKIRFDRKDNIKTKKDFSFHRSKKHHANTIASFKTFFYCLMVQKEIPSVFLFSEMVWNRILSIFTFRRMVRNEIMKFPVFFSAAKWFGTEFQAFLSFPTDFRAFHFAEQTE